MSSSVWITRRDGTDEKVATCQYGDDAELLFESYKQAGKACRVVFTGFFAKETTHSFTPPGAGSE